MSFPNLTGQPEVTAQRVLQSAAIGLMASQEDIEAVTKYLIENGIDKVAAPTAHKALRFLHMGILPSVQICESSVKEIAAAAISKCEASITSIRTTFSTLPNSTISH